MRTRPITNQFDSHGDVIATDPPADATARDLEELANAERKDPRFSRLLAKAPAKLGLLAIALLSVACATNADDEDLHALSACSVLDADNHPVSGSCESECQGISNSEAFAGSVCQSKAMIDRFGSNHPECHAIAMADGMVGCCYPTDHIYDDRVPEGSLGWDFYACDGDAQ